MNLDQTDKWNCDIISLFDCLYTEFIVIFPPADAIPPTKIGMQIEDSTSK